MSSQEPLYQAILARRSVRRYEKKPLDEAILEQVQRIVFEAQPLIPDNRYWTEIRSVASDEDLAKALGGFGRIVTSPHYIVPSLTGKHALEDLGYRLEQVAVRLAGLGVGSCFIGALGREARVRARFALPTERRIGALLIFGSPSMASGDRAVNAVMRAAAGASNKMPVNRIFFQDTFANPAMPPAELALLLEAARNAPSARNAQPWRFLWRDGRLYLFVTRHNLKYPIRPYEEYCFYDGGICMGNITLAMEALGMEGHWEMYEGTEPGLPPHPTNLQPLARLVITK